MGNKNRIKIVSEKYFNLLYYFNRILKKKKKPNRLKIGTKNIFLIYFSTDFKGVLTCLKRYLNVMLQNIF